MEVYLNRNPSSSHNFGFVTYYSREAAGRAICETNNRPPLNMCVNYCRKSEAKEQELQKKLQEICDIKPVDNGEELEDDWDTEIQKEEKMIASLDKFREDYSSGDEEIPIDKVKRFSHVSEVKEREELDAENVDAANPDALKNEISKKPPCKRCGMESKFVCKGCSSERYCSAACQSLEWPIHRTSCNMKIKSDLETEVSPKQELRVTADIHKENSSPVNVDSVNWLTNESCPTDLSEVSLNESRKASSVENEQDMDLLTLRNQLRELQKKNIGDTHSKPYPTNSDATFSPCPTSPHADHNRVYFEKDLAESIVDLWSEEIEVMLLEVDGHWALVRPIRKGTKKRVNIFHSIILFYIFTFHVRCSLPLLGEGPGRC